jgi:hypothetical protein
MAQVTATSLNLRDAPNGAKIGVLVRGAQVEILAQQDGWAHVSVTSTGQVGWASAGFLSDLAAPTAPAGATGLPPADSAAAPATVAGANALTPDGKIFAHRSGPGFATIGPTTLKAWLQSLAAPPPGISAAAVRTVQAMCVNEGGLEAINSYDNSFMSFGIFQWTAGAAGASGELAALLARHKAADPAAFADAFGQYGLDAQVKAVGAPTGDLVLNGKTLSSAADKAPLRGVDWAYRFWRAGHGDSLRACELAHAASRISRFSGLAAGAHPLGAWVTSEYGIALVLDEHVNRPGHVPKTLVTALTSLKLTGTKTDPATWTDADEAALIEAYLTARSATNMTDSQKRADRIHAAVATGELSQARGSFGM